MIDESFKSPGIGDEINSLRSGRDKLDTISVEIDNLKAMSNKIVKECLSTPHH